MKNASKVLLLAISLCSSQALAGVVVGADGVGPIEIYASDGTPITAYGPSEGTAGASDGLGGLFVAIPGFSSSTINVYGMSSNLLSSFFFTAPGDNRSDAAYITDLSWGAGGTLWIATFTGEIYHVASNGGILSSFDTGTTAPGVAFDGANLYTTSGPSLFSGGPFIYQRDLSGNILNTIDTGLPDTLGIGYDSADSSLWIGGIDILSQVDLSGNILQILSVDGTHYGVDVEQAGTLGSVPEPSNYLLILTGMIGLVVWKRRIKPYISSGLVLLALALSPARAAITISSLSASPSGSQPVGTAITLTASASDTDSGDLRYRFRIQPPGGAFAMFTDFAPANSVVWTPTDTDGVYQVEVTVLNRSTLNTQARTTSVTVSSLVTGSTPVVTATSHPLVALYSGPACAIGSTMRVRFKLPTDALWQSTALKPCNGSTSMNFLIAGMRASMTYQVRQDVVTGPSIVSGPVLNFATGAVGISVPAHDAILSLKAPSSLTEPVTLLGGLGSQGYPAFAVDAALNVIWYAPTTQVYLTRPVPGGGYLVTYGFTTDLSNSGLRQYDLAGHLVAQTTVERVNDQLTAVGAATVTAFHHEIRKLANGNYLLLAMTELASSIQGSPNDIAADEILVLDSNMQLLWSWNSTLHLDLSRSAVLGETCGNGAAQCVLFNGSTAHDWTHGNSVSLTPDGNLVYSARHQDFAYKIAYQNGAGDGHVIWRLGKDGDFTFVSGDPYPWFSHQHDVEYEDSTTISLFDDGNTRVQANGGHSRGQALRINESNMTATVLLNADLGSYSLALGSAQRLLNGNYVFDSGIIGGGANTQVPEVTAAGAFVSNTHVAGTNYRTFRLRDLYSAPY